MAPPTHTHTRTHPQYAEAAEQYELSLRRRPGHGVFLEALGRCYLRLGRMKSSARALRAALDAQEAPLDQAARAKAERNLGEAVRMVREAQETGRDPDRLEAEVSTLQ